MIIVRELGNLLDFDKGVAKSFENLSDVGSWLHRDNSKLILLIDPGEESFIFVVEDTSIMWPVSVEATSVKESISLLEEEVVINELFSIFLRQGVERVIGTLQLTVEFIESFAYLIFDLFSLDGVVQGWTQWERSQVSSNSNSSADDHLSLIRWEIGGVKLDACFRLMHIGFFMTVIIFYNLIKE